MKKLIPAYVSVLVLFFAAFGAMEYFVDSGDKPAFIKYPMVSVFLMVFLFVLIAISITMRAVDNITYQLMTEEEKAKLNAAGTQSFTESDWYKKLVSTFVRPESTVVSEDQLLLEHDYDGIKELDNNLPPWWVYLFYASIVFGVVYMVRFEILGADDQEMELAKEIAQAKIEVAEYMKTAPDMMDEKTVTVLTDPADLAVGKEIYTTNCAACHRADAGGQIGPNLTDDEWILGGGIKNIFHTLVNGGRDGKGMIAWKGTLKPKEMQKVASYIISLKGSNPVDPKAPEGEVWVEE
ncbi:c-type cytochrome [Flavobacterium galactosidilyticum]|uniref:cbb3-type cytochrome c oxidase N-terminal domain-containing protein n=1 Tax=Flavobacterium galactosidilyticum TaxID=2893886 RepID=UPI001E4D4C4E|nr:cbb3-type cytochrome c oxidase N-terminal domain-containing protein [Flavobacterium sp. F-340]UFH45061.1 c-type cytochrome [Flavobacterium sp. F-340]